MNSQENNDKSHHRGIGRMDRQEQEQEQDEFLDSHLHQDKVKDNALEKKWIKIKEDFLHKYDRLSRSDIVYAPGEFGHMLKHLQYKTGKSLRQLREEIASWEN
ncbi:hypothetical protein [Sinomicrobium soli]|uniref:hypothetical protein n=1 Tax=Sinomicrobium sp. N-1-3-6 TaxID=2219864 RepID=UPI000DCBC093|nr:hypothetical protein [Sinomicrobium sp. N-1-3-6]RAV28641.1 hypothetical protein DN748_11830 [Sinomicrobium sp. N-1-3-6]